MECKKNVVKVVLKSNQNTLFTITCRSERELSDNDLISAVKSFYNKFYDNVEVEIVKDIGHFTDIKVSGIGIDLLLSWSFVSNVTLS